MVHVWGFFFLDKINKTRTAILYFSSARHWQKLPKSNLLRTTVKVTGFSLEIHATSLYTYSPSCIVSYWPLVRSLIQQLFNPLLQSPLFGIFSSLSCLSKQLHSFFLSKIISFSLIGFGHFAPWLNQSPIVWITVLIVSNIRAPNHVSCPQIISSCL